MTTPRDVAAVVLARVDKEGSFAAAALQAELARAVQLDARDRALATEIVYGSLRAWPWLVARIEEHAARGIGRLDARVRAHLVVAAYQLLFMRVPAFAAVHEAVSAVRATRGDKLAAFANAVLPPWLRASLERTLGEPAARAFLASSLETPAVALRIERAAERDAWVDRLRGAAPNASFAAGRLSPHAVLARGAGHPAHLPGWAEGAWSVQEEGSQVAALAVGVAAGERVLDACAGRGNKTAVLARAAGPSGAVDACDASPAKLERLRVELSRLGLAASASFAVDWTVGSADVPGSYDRVLVDAPCSGTGTLRRRPEIALRGDAGDLAALTRAQIAITSRAAAHLRPGGRLVYVVCSVLREECEDVIEALLAAGVGLRRAPFDAEPARGLAGESADLRLLPHVHGTDGYFVASFVRAE